LDQPIGCGARRCSPSTSAKEVRDPGRNPDTRDESAAVADLGHANHAQRRARARRRRPQRSRALRVAREDVVDCSEEPACARRRHVDNLGSPRWLSDPPPSRRPTSHTRERHRRAGRDLRRVRARVDPERVAASLGRRLGALGTFAFDVVGEMWARPVLSARPVAHRVSTLAAQARDEELELHTGSRHGNGSLAPRSRRSS
jgi:hypothetical protein